MQCPFTPDGDLSVVSPDSCVHIPQKMKDFAQVSVVWSACMINLVGTVHNESMRTSHDNLYTSEHLQVDLLWPIIHTGHLPLGVWYNTWGFTEHNIPYSRKLSREKTFANFTVLWLFAKVFSTKFGGVVSFGAAQANNPRKFSQRKPSFSPLHESFLPWKFPAIQ